MILIDANLLIYAHSLRAPQYPEARRWLEGVVASESAVRIAWVVAIAFLRITTNPRMEGSAMTVETSVAHLSKLLDCPNAGILNPGERHWTILSRLLPEAQVRGPLVTDAHLAALAIEHGATLATNDRDFTRFPGLKLSFPLARALGRR